MSESVDMQIAAVSVRIDVPEGWSAVNALGDSVTTVWPEEYRGPLLPSVVVADTVDPGIRGFRTYVDTILTEIYSALPGHVIQLSLGAGPPETMDLTVASDPLGIDMTVAQRHRFLGNGRAVVATGSAADVDWPDIGAVLIRSVRSLEVGGASA